MKHLFMLTSACGLGRTGGRDWARDQLFEGKRMLARDNLFLPSFDFGLAGG